MKKCTGCHQEIDKYAIACEYCGELSKEKSEKNKGPESDSSVKENEKNTEKDSGKEE